MKMAPEEFKKLCSDIGGHFNDWGEYKAYTCVVTYPQNNPESSSTIAQITLSYNVNEREFGYMYFDISSEDNHMPLYTEVTNITKIIRDKKAVHIYSNGRAVSSFGEWETRE